MKNTKIFKFAIFIICFINIIFFLSGCNEEKTAERKYKIAKRLELEHKYTEAIKQYEIIAEKYSKTELAKSIQKDIKNAQKEKLQYYITENKPKVIAAVRNYPFPPIFDSNTMKQIENIAKAQNIPFVNEPRVDRELKAAEIAVCATMPVQLAYYCLQGAKQKFIWNATSTDNEKWTVSMKSSPNKILDPNSKPHTSILKVNITNKTLALTTRDHCGSFAPDLEKKISKKKGKINWEKECVVPLEIEGVLK